MTSIANNPSKTQKRPAESVEAVFGTRDSPQTKSTPRPRQGLWRPIPVWRVWRDGGLAEGVGVPQTSQICRECAYLVNFD